LASAWPFRDDDGVYPSLARRPRIACFTFLVNPSSLTRRPDMGQLHDQMAQELTLRNFSPAVRWRAHREVVILCG
jgi:hypothetical protein